MKHKSSFAVVAAFLSFITIFTASTASAHTVLVTSDPAAGATIHTLPEKITLTFANPLLSLGTAAINQVKVIDPMGMEITSTNNVVHGSVLSNVLSPTMVMSGDYHVTFRVAAQDGHVLNGNFTFSVGNTSATNQKINIPHSGEVALHAFATGKGIIDGTGSATDTAKGTFSIDFNDDTFCYTITTKITDITAGHVHALSQKNLTISDEIFLPLKLTSINAAHPICENAPGETLAILAAHASDYVFMLHTKRFPDGDVAGELQTSISQNPIIQSVSVTATTKNSDSAIALKITNPSPTTILITAITSNLASSSMIFYDANMCQGNSTMQALSNIAIAPDSVVSLGYKYQGAMLSHLKVPLKIGSQIPLTVTWTDNQGGAHKQIVVAKVVVPPQGLNFGMSSMSGMSM